MKQTIPAVSIVGLLAAFGLTCFFIAKFADRLPKDGGREFAHDGKLSAGKPRGAGLIFILVFVGAAFIFAPMSLELLIYLILVTVEMLTGYLDDAAEHPWGELRKGLLDLAVAVILAVTYLSFNPNTIWLAIPGMPLTIPPVLFGALIVVLVWGSVNVTNCADGVDGLSGTLVIITLATFYIIDHLLGSGDDFNVLILMFAVCILGYLWYNATPSLLMMGDAGSRAMGVFISIAALKSESPVLYVPVAVVLILDGGLGLLKLTLIRVCHVHILKNVRTPLHDHVRKNMGWSNTQTLFRFAIIQIAVSMITLSLILL
ncbi:MAG: phospho-N-acetylmuramoyl-pentapeptide-transferase [Lachnospiraceae bacterium]|nr:phospho-N-acetylmuramoyl-pentapeptide-transferase [Lachnospiraceae bacterium]